MMIKIFLVFTLFFNTLFALDAYLLKSFRRNHELRFYNPYYFFTCHPYGITTISELSLTKTCQEEIKQFRRKNPKEKHAASYLLHIEQQYGLQAVGMECLVHINSGLTYSEYLLKQGYAFMRNDIKDIMLQTRFKKAQSFAKERSLGIFKDERLLKCLGLKR